MSNIIDDNELNFLENNGYVVIRNFLSDVEMSPLLSELEDLILAFGITNEQLNSFKSIDEAFVEIIKNNKNLKPFLYDRLQQVPQLLKLPSTDKVFSLSKLILKTNSIGVWPRVQIRLDLAEDSENLIEWHTDYSYNRGTSNSYTFWLPLVPIDKAMGPIKMVPSSHKKEYKFITNTNARRHSLTIEDEEIKKLDTIQIDQFQAGDLVLFHSKFLHSGMINTVKNRARLVCVFRMQNLNTLEIFSGKTND
jgi:ectoine hydroxylase-related dioxygenase (phytanoyl-CoA dioxygenase family)